METTIVYMGFYMDNGTENGNYCSMYSSGFRPQFLKGFWNPQ